MDKLPTLSDKESLILKLLINHGAELYGLQMVDYSEGKLKKGTVYVTLERMVNKGYVTSRKETGADSLTGVKRRLYKITGIGKRVLEARELISSYVLEGYV